MAEIREVIYQHSQGRSQRKISESLGMSRLTIRKYIRLAQEFDYKSGVAPTNLDQLALKVHTKVYKEGQNPPKKSIEIILPFHDRIKELRGEPWITHKQIHRLLSAEGLLTSERSLGRYMATAFPKLPKSTVHLLTVPAQEAQVDYGYVGIINKRKTYAFVMTLSHSRHRYVEFVHSQNQLSWAQSHINAFAFFGGVPRCILLDNLKAGVITADIYDPTLNETYAELARFYGFVADPAKARTPEHKGKVERSVRIVKEQLIAGITYKNLEEMNASARDWCLHKISQIVCSTTGEKPYDTFVSEELPLLMSVPSDAFDMPAWLEGKVHLDHHVVVKGNFYSLPTQFIGTKVQIRLGLKTVRLYQDHQLLKTHVRAYDKGQWITDSNDYNASAREHLDMTPEACLEKARAIGESTEIMIKKTLEPTSKTALRKSHGILRLAKTYEESRLEDACLRAIAFENYDYKSLKKFLEKGLDQKQTKTFSTEKKAAAYCHDGAVYSSNMEVHYG